MPRSKKTKKNCATLRPPPKPNVTSEIPVSEKQQPTLTPRPKPSFPSSNVMDSNKQPSTHRPPSTFQKQKTEEIMISRAIASAKKHEIDVRQGRPISADGNCAIESVIANINERQCFSDSFNFTPDYYRRIWVTDFKNRTMNDKIMYCKALIQCLRWKSADMKPITILHLCTAIPCISNSNW